MDVLGQLESRVELLLERLDTFKIENARLRGENESLAAECESLRAGLRREEARRQAALARLEALVEKIRERGGADRE